MTHTFNEMLVRGELDD